MALVPRQRRTLCCRRYKRAGAVGRGQGWGHLALQGAAAPVAALAEDDPGRTGLVAILASDATTANCLLSPCLRLRPNSSPPKDYGGLGGSRPSSDERHVDLGRRLALASHPDEGKGSSSSLASQLPWQLHRSHRQRPPCHHSPPPALHQNTGVRVHRLGRARSNQATCLGGTI